MYRQTAVSVFYVETRLAHSDPNCPPERGILQMSEWLLSPIFYAGIPLFLTLLVGTP